VGNDVSDRLVFKSRLVVDLDETDISQLEAPTFTTLTRGPPEPMLRLDWSLPVNLIGEKVLNPMIHCCDKCLKPILIYGRLVRPALVSLSSSSIGLPNFTRTEIGNEADSGKT